MSDHAAVPNQQYHRQLILMTLEDLQLHCCSTISCCAGKADNLAFLTKTVSDDSHKLLVTTTLQKFSNMSHFMVIHLLFHHFKTNFPVWKSLKTICNGKALFFTRDRIIALPKQSSSEQFSSISGLVNQAQSECNVENCDIRYSVPWVGY